MPPELLDYTNCSKVHWMRLFEAIPMVVSECNSLLRFVDKLMLCPVLVGVQSSCSPVAYLQNDCVNLFYVGNSWESLN